MSILKLIYRSECETSVRRKSMIREWGWLPELQVSGHGNFQQGKHGDFPKLALYILALGK